MQNIRETSILQLQKTFMDKKMSVQELVQEYLRRIELIDKGTGKLNSILEINPDALSIAKNLDNEHFKYSSPLYGVPVLLKDNIDTADRMHTSAGSLALAESIASSDADIVKILRQKGALILGKTNMTEFANHMTKGMIAGYSSRGGIVKCPYNKSKNPSGSSTGSAVATSSNLCMASIGTDTSGSIITPSITNGIVGFRPSMGSLSQKGIIPISFTLDTAGPMTRTIIDSIILYSELSNKQINLDELNIKDIVIGLDESTFDNMADEEVKRATTIIKTLEKTGIMFKRVKIPQIPTKYLKEIQLHEFKYSINRYLSNLPSNFKIHSLKDIIEFNNLNPTTSLKYGQTLLLKAEYETRGDLSEIKYVKLLAERDKTKNEVTKILDNLDICLFFKNNLLFQYTGLPVITIPHGLYNNGMPYGVYLSARNDTILLKNAYLIDKIIGYRVAPNE